MSSRPKNDNYSKEIENIKSNPIIAVYDDIPQIRAMGYNFWKEDGVYSQDFYISVLKQNLSLVYKYQRYRIIAVCLAYYDEKTDFIDIALLCVRKDFQRKGFGESILRQCINRCVEKGYKKFYLHVATTNTKAFKLYEKLGFVIAEIKKNYYYNEKEEENRKAYLMQYIVGNNIEKKKEHNIKSEEKKENDIQIIIDNKPKINNTNINNHENRNINNNYLPNNNINNEIYKINYANNQNNYLNNNINIDNNLDYIESYPNKNSNLGFRYINESKNVNNNIYNDANNNIYNNYQRNSNYHVTDYRKGYWDRVNQYKKNNYY